MDEGLLISLVEKHRNLYDKQTRDFKDARIRENSWEEISLAMGESAEECQRVWRNLRDRFVRERKTAKATVSGEEAREPQWSLYRSLAFLEKHIAPRRTTSNVKKPQPPSRPTSAASGDMDISPYDSVSTILSPQQSSSDSFQRAASETPQVSDVDDGFETPTTSRPPPSKRVARVPPEATTEVDGPSTAGPSTAGPSTAGASKPRQRKRDATDDRIIAAAMETVASRVKEATNKPTANQAFTKYVEARLEELPLQKQKIARRLILNVLDDVEENQ